MRLEAMLDDHRKTPPDKGSKSQVLQNYKEKETYLNYEVCMKKFLGQFRFRTFSLDFKCKFYIM